MNDNVKVSFEYDPSNPEHLMALNRYLKSMHMANALWDIQELRRKYKYVKLTDDQWKIVDEYTENINRILETYNIGLDELII